jgi:hypothetical protein
MLRRWTIPELATAFAGVRFQPFPPATERSAWATRLTGQRATDLAAMRVAQPAAPPVPTREQWAAYAATGERLAFETPFIARRQYLSCAALAAAAGDNAAVHDMVATARAILAEPAWWLPAHDRMRPDNISGGGAAPDPMHPVVDLFAADTAALLAELDALHGAGLDTVAPGLRGELRAEIARRIIEPALALDWWWLRGTNNWTPWCCAMVLLAAAHLVADTTVLARLADRFLQACDGYLAAYPGDGGCEEGLMYWSVSPPMLALFLETLRERSGGRLDLWDEPKLAPMAAFLPRQHLGGGRFPCFADCRPVAAPRPGLYRRFAVRSGARELAGILPLISKGTWSDFNAAARSGAPLVYWLRDVWWDDDCATPVTAREDDWLAESQILVARDPASGLALAVKGGTTGASHGHLDVGQFVIHRHGDPLLVDAGMGGYHAAVFGPERFAQPWIRAADHNAPIIGEITQTPGREHAARVLEQGRDGGRTRVVFDLSDAYPRAAGIAAVTRTVALDRDRSRATVTDQIRCRTALPVTLNLLAAVGPRVSASGVIELGEAARVRLCHDPARLMLVGIETVAMTDPWLRRGWGERLCRLCFRTQPATVVAYTLEVTAATQM